MDESRRTFWDDFSNLADQKQQQQQPSAIGTSAMGMGKRGPAAAAPKKKNDEWDDW